ncbi:MAG TPA: response regulator [Pyrinomonadaceae bacterium]|jgi:CheY-like chemotaxis protein
MRILCVEDNQDTCELLTTLLGVSDLEAVAVSTAAEALRLMKAERFDLYLMDGRLPDADGVALCEQIRQVDKITPVVFFTGKAYESDREAALAAGADAYVIKPDTDTLVPTVKRLLEEARPR